MSQMTASNPTLNTKKWVYEFNGKNTQDILGINKSDIKNLLGGKGANLAEMSRLGLPVPPGFTISTEVCTYYYDHEKSYPQDLKDQVLLSLLTIEKEVGAIFGDVKNPLLVSVRSGARASMPGMMDTILNLGLNDETVIGLAKKSGDERFAYDSYRRFIQMYSNVVLDIDHYEFEDVLDTFKRHHDIVTDTDMSADDWKEIIADYKRIVEEACKKPFPQDVHEQLWMAISAVFNSWMNHRAITYRRLNNIPASWGTAVNIQAMVFGNMGEDCATGVAFTRNPSTGENRFYGEFLINAQGEDVVAGIRTPQQLTRIEREEQNNPLPSMEEAMPDVFRQLCDIRLKLETHYSDMQDIEFTVQQNKLYMLQTRNGKRTAEAALRIAVEMVEEGLISKEEAILRVEPSSLDQLLHPTLDPKAKRNILAKGLPASPGAASGQIVFSADDAEKFVAEGKKVILCRIETSPEDIHGMHAANGILTSRGGMTSHAAVVARGMGRTCVAGASSITIDYKTQTMKIAEFTLNKGDMITIDGNTGEIIKGLVPTLHPELSGNFATLMSWADDVRRMKIRANAETPLDAGIAKKFGAEGIGLCRTEHMFFDPKRILHMREMILATDKKSRKDALSKLEPVQQDDFKQIFEIMGELPVTIRLLDPPLHEFLPHSEGEITELAQTLSLSVQTVKDRIARLHESNPMLGHRGCRLGITYPEIYDMQIRAILNAANDVANAKGYFIIPEIMIPLVGSLAEFEFLKKRVDEIAKETTPELNYTVGTMIELPRAALCANQIAEKAHFFSFGTNDLTQTTLGISRDDAHTFLPSYQSANIMENDPFVTLDIEGVGQLIEMAYRKGKSVRPDIKTGICGEHGGDPASIAFCEKIGLSYVSCSPYRVPIARLAAAQATLKYAKKNTEKTRETAALKVA